MDIKERILMACRELSRSGGFYNINMDDLAARAGVSKRTVYRYFRSKEEIIEATLDAFMIKSGEEIERLLNNNTEPDVFIASVFEYLSLNAQFIISPAGLDELRKHYPLLWQKIDAFRVKKISKVIQKLIVSSKNPSIAKIDQRIITAVITASIQSVLTPDFILDHGLTFEETASQLSQLLISALT